MSAATTVFTLLGILGGLFVGIILPGPSFILVVRTSIAQSRSHGLRAALGMGVGGLIFALLALTGLRAVLAAVPWLYLALKFVGGLYLIWLGVGLWRGANEGFQVPEEGATPASRRSFFVALVTQLSNPKTALFYSSVFAAVLPASFAAWWFLVLPPLIFVLEAGWYTVVALVFSAAAPRAAYLRFKGSVDRVAGTIIGALGLRLLFDRHALGH
ncbi:LysE family translocator [Deinococcus sp.]|uniref:LysE family translocator n=1 Tax=Deinococcus sp. TaxID=47478 RepID=UPI003CC5A4C6